MKKTKQAEAELKRVQKVRSLPGYDRFHLLAVHTGGNLETLIFRIDFSFFVQLVRNVQGKESDLLYQS